MKASKFNNPRIKSVFPSSDHKLIILAETRVALPPHSDSYNFTDCFTSEISAEITMLKVHIRFSDI